MTYRRLCVLALAFYCTASPSVALAQRLGGAPALELPILRLTLGLLLGALMAFVAAIALRRFMRTGRADAASFLRPAPRKLSVIESRRLSPHADICLLACDGREYLVVVSAAGATLLHDKARSEEPPP